MKNFLKSVRHAMIRSARLRRDRETLHEMPDALLDDMGISRSMINYYTSAKALRQDSIIDR